MEPSFSELCSWWATVATALIAVLALAVAYLQVNEGRRIQRYANAFSGYRDYMKLAFDYPEFTEHSQATFDFEGRAIDGDRLKFEKYEWFVSIMLHACEEMLFNTDAPEWKAALRLQVLYQREYLMKKWKDYRDVYSSEFAELVDDALKSQPAAKQ